MHSTEPGPGSPPLAGSNPDPMVGSVIAGKYELIRLLGQGGMGAVYEGRNTSTLKRCAVKVLLSAELASSGEIVQRFFREARASSVLESDHIVQIFDSGADPATNYPYMVMELLQGEDLEHTLRRNGTLPPLVAAKLVLQAAMGLAKAHEQHTVHRDIKPANIYLTRRESGEMVVKILDFGIAKVKMEKFSETSAGLTRTGSMLGTPLYMSPEQARGAANIDVRSDVWSLGIVLYELLSGSLPYSDASSLGELMVSIITADLPLIQDKAAWVPPELAEIAHRAISRDINKRYKDAGELRDALIAIIPDGSRITPDMLMPLPMTQRQFVAPRLQLTDDGMLRAATRTGLAITNHGPPAKKASKAPAIAIGVLTAIVALGAVAVTVLVRKPPVEVHTSTPGPETIKSVIVTERVTAPPVEKSFLLTINAPPEVEVSVDGAVHPVVGNVVEISGVPGATRKVKLSLGDQVQEQTVVITESGVMPDKLELVKRAVAQVARPGAKSAAPEKPASGKPADAPAKPKKPAVETGMDEFK